MRKTDGLQCEENLKSRAQLVPDREVVDNNFTGSSVYFDSN